MTFLVAFAVMCSGLTSAATLSRAFGGDCLSEFVEVPTVPVAPLFITAVALVNFRGTSESVHLNVVLTSIELTGLLIVVVIGLAAVAEGGPSVDAGRVLDFKVGEGIVSAIVRGAGLALFALIGFEDSVNLAEEARDPGRLAPRAARRPGDRRRDLSRGHARRLDGRPDRAAGRLRRAAARGRPDRPAEGRTAIDTAAARACAIAWAEQRRSVA